MSPRARHSRRGSPRGARGAAAWLVSLLVFIAAVLPVSTSTGEDLLTASVIPGVVPAGVAGITVTVVGTNFVPADDATGALSIVCVFSGVDGPNSVVPARVVAGSGVSCVVPYNPPPSGFVSLGLSGNGGVDAKFFRDGAGGGVLAFAASGALRSVVGPKTWAFGDAVMFTGTDLAPMAYGGIAVVGASFPCGWRDAATGDGGESPGAFVSTAIRVCETSPPFLANAPGDTHGAMRVVATLDLGHRRSGVRGVVSLQKTESAKTANETDATRDAVTGAAALAVVIADPPLVTSVAPSTVASEGGGSLEISTRGAFGNALASREGAWARIGTTRVTADPGSNPDGTTKTTLWRCITPARKHTPWVGGHGGSLTSPHGWTETYPSVAIANAPFGAERVGVAATNLRFVSALRIASLTVNAFAFEFINPSVSPLRNLFNTGTLAVAGHHANSIYAALGVGVSDLVPVEATYSSFAFGVANGAPVAPALLAASVTRSAYPAHGPSGGGGVVWVTGASLARGACDFGFGFGDTPKTFSDTAGVRVSSALVACEAPALERGGVASATRVTVSGATGSVAYRYLPELSHGWDVPFGGVSRYVATPTNGPSRGGTAVSLSRPKRATKENAAGSGFEASASASGAGACRFGPVAVAARDVLVDSLDDGVGSGTVGTVSCVAPAGKPGVVVVAVTDSAPGAACDSAWYAVAEMEWRRHRLDDGDA